MYNTMRSSPMFGQNARTPPQMTIYHPSPQRMMMGGSTAGMVMGGGGSPMYSPYRPPSGGTQPMTTFNMSSSRISPSSSRVLEPSMAFAGQPTDRPASAIEGSSSNNGATFVSQDGSAGTEVTPVNDSSNRDETVANTKEKTPMCLVNELSRFNKIQHTYSLTDEQGPAHKKTFFVKLKLGEEEFSASDQSIKKAQHAAASVALEQTKYKRPPIKNNRHVMPGKLANPSVTPTVELNALAMKRGEQVAYQQVECPRQVFYPMPSYDFRGMGNQRYHYPKPPHRFCVHLKVGCRDFLGEGQTMQAARHSVAFKALEVLNSLPIPHQESPSVPVISPTSDESPEEVPVEPPTSQAGETNHAVVKSEISMVHEIALKRNFTVEFEVTKESGPPHLRSFVTRCTCGNLVAEGEGNSKRLSKKRAAEKMMEELNKLSPLPAPTVEKLKKPFLKPKQNKSLIKMQKANPDYGAGINPISRLIQIQQAKKECEPAYSVLEEKGLPRNREFVVQVTVGDKACNASGPNKKLAKRNAAEQMLQLLGYSRPTPQPAKPAIKTTETMSPVADKKVTFIDLLSEVCPQQHVPGVIVVPSGSPRALIGQQMGSYPAGPSPSDGGVVQSDCSNETTATIVNELLNTGISSTAESMLASRSITASAAVVSSSVQSSISPKDQLLYLGRVLGFQVQFTDFPKGNKTEYLSLVTLSTNPVQHSHGQGQTIEASHDSAALVALRNLAALGLDGMGCSSGGVGGGGDGHNHTTNMHNWETE